MTPILRIPTLPTPKFPTLADATPNERTLQRRSANWPLPRIQVLRGAPLECNQLSNYFLAAKKRPLFGGKFDKKKLDHMNMTIDVHVGTGLTVFFLLNEAFNP